MTSVHEAKLTGRSVPLKVVLIWLGGHVLPHWRAFLLVLFFMAVYGTCNALRLGLFGLLLDNIHPTGDLSQKSVMQKFYDKNIAPYLPDVLNRPEVQRESFAVETLTLAKGTYRADECEHEKKYRSVRDTIAGLKSEAVAEPKDGCYREIFVSGELSKAQLLSGATLTNYAFDRVEILVDTPLAGRALPIEAGPAIVTLQRGDAEAGRMSPTLYTIAALGMVLAIFIGISNYGRLYLTQVINVHIIADIRSQVFRHLSRLSVDFFHGNKSGDLISRVTNDVGSIQLSLRYVIGEVLQDPFTIAASLTAAFFVSWQLTLLIFPFLVLILVPIIRSGVKVKKHGRGSMVKLGEVTDAMSQLLAGIRVVKAFSLEHAQAREFDLRTGGFIKSSLKMVRAKVRGRALAEGLYNFIAALAMLFAGWMLTSTVMPIKFSEFVVFFAAISSLYQPFKALSRAYNTVQESHAGAERILEILAAKPTVSDRADAPPFAPLRREIEFDHVSFRYGAADQQSPVVLRDVCLTVKKGETIALVGRTGAGKSTLLDLLARFYDPVEGTIRVDGVDLRAGAHASLLQQIAIVGQDPFLFNTTIEKNIRYGNPAATTEQVTEAARAAAVLDDILAKPDGFATVIGERGAMLSGGQRQRVTIARAILKDPAILILDEATSALDTESERKVQAALENLMRGRTTFVIAHRLSTIQHADRILVMEAGVIVESGNHQELLARDGYYARLLRLQGGGLVLTPDP
ncbi:MAG: ABC transporter ATP-binding protein [Planctomycetota bacterium]